MLRFNPCIGKTQRAGGHHRHETPESDVHETPDFFRFVVVLPQSHRHAHDEAATFSLAVHALSARADPRVFKGTAERRPQLMWAAWLSSLRVPPIGPRTIDKRAKPMPTAVERNAL